VDKWISFPFDSIPDWVLFICQPQQAVIIYQLDRPSASDLSFSPPQDRPGDQLADDLLLLMHHGVVAYFVTPLESFNANMSNDWFFLEIAVQRIIRSRSVVQESSPGKIPS